MVVTRKAGLSCTTGPPAEPRQVPHVTIPATRSRVQFILCRGSKHPGGSGMNFSEHSGVMGGGRWLHSGRTSLFAGICFRTCDLLAQISAGAALCCTSTRYRCRQPTNLATGHPCLARGMVRQPAGGKVCPNVRRVRLRLRSKKHGMVWQRPVKVHQWPWTGNRF